MRTAIIIQFPTNIARDWRYARLQGCAAAAIYAYKRDNEELRRDAVDCGQLLANELGNPEAFIQALRELRPYKS